MKNILKGTIIFAVCLTLAACGTGSPQEITVQSITEPMTTMQTVGNVPEVTSAVTENTDNWTEPAAAEEPDDWTELAMTDGTDNTNDPAFDPPMQEIPVHTVETVTFPKTIEDWVYADIIEDLFDEGLTSTAIHGSIFENGSYYNNGISDYDECNICYKKLLLEKFLDCPENFELFGGAFFCDGWFHLLITDWEKKDDIFGDPLAKIQNVSVASCDYSYSYLLDVLGAVIDTEITYEEGLTSYGIEISENRVYATVLTEEVREKVLAAVESAGLDTNAVNAIVCDYVIAKPC